MEVLSLQSVGFFAASIIGFFAGCLWVNGQQNLEISRLNSELKAQQSEVAKANQIIENHKQFIRRKDTLVRRFCDQYFQKDGK